MWASIRRTAPSSPLPVAVNPPPRNMSWSTCRLSAIRAGPESLRSSAPVQSSWPPMWAPIRRTAPSLAGPVAVNPPRRKHGLIDLQACRRPGRGRSRCAGSAPVQSRLPPMWAPGRRTAPALPLPVAVNPPSQVHVLADLQVVGVQGGAGVVAQLRPGAVELAADVGAGAGGPRHLAAAGGGEPVVEEHVLVDLQAVGDQGGAGVVAQLAPVQSSWPPMWAPSRRTAPSSPLPVAVNPPRRKCPGRPAGRRRTGPGRSRCAGSPRDSRGCRRCGHRAGGPRRRAWPVILPRSDRARCR